MDHLEHVDHLAHLVHLEPMDYPERLETLDQQDRLEFKDSLARLVSPDHWDPLDHLVSLERMVSRVAAEVLEIQVDFIAVMITLFASKQQPIVISTLPLQNIHTYLRVHVYTVRMSIRIDACMM